MIKIDLNVLSKRSNLDISYLLVLIVFLVQGQKKDEEDKIISGL